MAHVANPRGVLYLLRKGVAQELAPGERMVRLVESFFQRYRKLVRAQEAGEKVPWVVRQEAGRDWAQWREFREYYTGEWLPRVQVVLDRPELEQYETREEDREGGRAAGREDMMGGRTGGREDREGGRTGAKGDREGGRTGAREEGRKEKTHAAQEHFDPSHPRNRKK